MISPLSSLPADAAPRRRGRRLRWLLAAGGLALLSGVAVRLRSDAAERRHAPDGRFVVVRGVRVHLHDWGGSGPPLVLLHSNGSLLQDFEISGLVALARERFRVIAFDRPGHGWSDRPDGTRWTAQAQADLLHEAMQLLGLPPALVLGHSWGAQAALALALRHPASVRALVLLSGYYYPGPRLDTPFLVLPALPVLGTLLRHTIAPVVGRLVWPLLVRAAFAPQPVTPAFEQRFPTWMALRPAQLRGAASDSAWLIPGAWMLRRHYRRLRVPAVVMAGDGDRLVSWRAHSQRLQRELPQAVLHLSRGSGHMLHHEAPHEVMAAIDAAAALAGPAVEEEAFPLPAGSAGTAASGLSA